VKRSHAIALVLLVAGALLGVAVMLERALELRDAFDPFADAQVAVLFIAVAAVLVILGFFIGVIHFRSSGQAREDRATIGRLREALEAERNKRKDVAEERHSLSQKVVALEDDIKQLRLENERAADAVGREQRDGPKVEELRGEVARLKEENERLREERARAEVQARAAVDEARETLAGIEDRPPARDEIDRLANECDRLRVELKSRRERMVDLQADLSVAETEAAQARAEAEELRELRSEPAKPMARLEGQSLHDVLDTMVGLEGVTVALVADGEGLVVDSAGEVLQPDALAAVSGLVAELSPRVSDLLPIGEISQVALGDIKGKVMEVRYFPLFGESCALAIIRDETHPHPEIAKDAIEVIVSKLAD
jgi:predicted regulator of Ras-like GTPase activity (Roadblock/LC7/MglB family)